jgi:hypothetical protein
MNDYDPTRARPELWKRIQLVVALFAVAFGVTLAYIIGDRLSQEALAVLAGAACGVGAAIPTSLLIVAATKRHQATQPPSGQQPPYPPVVVVTPPGQTAYPPPPGGTTLTQLPIGRTFEIVGDED